MSSLLPVVLCLLLLGISSERAHGQEAPPEEETEPEATPEPEKYQSNLTFVIPVSDLEFYVKNDTGRDILKAQFHSVREGQRKPWVVGTTDANMKKNRYDDLPAYDETRVILEPLPDDNSSDYINANYINGYYREKEYVATQGPLPNTINDFWRMVWQLGSHKIVMLANVMEHGKVKVEKYWPDNNGTYGDLVVKTLSQKAFRDHVARTFSVREVGDMRNRIIRQFHYTGWPDFGVPADRLSVVALMRQARKYHRDETAPLIVHCSAGVGRTGTVILMDSSLQKASHEREVDILKRLDVMREQRINVVEKEDQYVWAHEVIYDIFHGNGTEAYLKEFDYWYETEFAPSVSTTESAEDASEVQTT